MVTASRAAAWRGKRLAIMTAVSKTNRTRQHFMLPSSRSPQEGGHGIQNGADQRKG
jgi:hypothetical protein